MNSSHAFERLGHELRKRHEAAVNWWHWSPGRVAVGLRWARAVALLGCLGVAVLVCLVLVAPILIFLGVCAVWLCLFPRSLT